jgi:HEAT repeat protein
MAIPNLIEIAAAVPEAADALLTLPDDPESRLAAAQALGRVKPVNAKTVSTLLRLLREAELQQSRRLTFDGPGTTKSAVMQILNDSQVMEYQECASFTSDTPAMSDLRNLLVAAAKGRRLMLMEEICRALGRAGAAGKDALPALELLRRHADPAVRLTGLIAEARIDPARGSGLLAGLREALGSPEFPVRAAAANALAEFGPAARDALPDLERMREDTVRHVRTQVQAAIGAISR